jgi:hypothetical protein
MLGHWAQAVLDVWQIIKMINFIFVAKLTARISDGSKAHHLSIEFVFLRRKVFCTEMGILSLNYRQRRIFW